jgi:cytochrome P450
MRPPVTLGVYKVIPPESGETTLCGVRLPVGTAVGFNAVAMLRRRDVFGKDSQLFRPERFLECDEQLKMTRIHTVELAFGYGRWMCAGKTLALIELNKIFFEVRIDSLLHTDLSLERNTTWVQVVYG